ncbi:ORF6N domain-containing protein [Bacteroidota bacterium]
MEKTTTVSKEILVDKFLYISNQKMMLGYDLALNCTTSKCVHKQVKRNINRFPNNFMFQLTLEEKEEAVANFDHLENFKFS